MRINTNKAYCTSYNQGQIKNTERQQKNTYSIFKETIIRLTNDFSFENT